MSEDKETRLGRKYWILTISIEDCQRIITVDQRRGLRIWENCVTELYDWAKRPENLEIETEEAVDTVQKTLTVRWEMAIKEVRDKKTMYLWMYSDCWEKMVSN
jgi:hypothetical protein